MAASGVPMLFVGDVNGNFDVAFSKVKKVVDKTNKDMAFKMLFCIGNFFGEDETAWTEYLKKNKKAPLQTYVLGPLSEKQVSCYPNLESCDIAEQVTYLGKLGVLTTVEGLRIAYISGVESVTGTGNEFSYDRKDVLKLINSCNNSKSDRHIDILLSYQWPHGIKSENPPFEPKNSSKLLGYLVSKICPRVHIAACEGILYDRAPFPHYDNSGSITACTRFIALSNVGNPNPQYKWIYAMKIPLTLKSLAQYRGEQTAFPFEYAKELDDCERPVNNFFDLTSHKRPCKQKRKEKRYKRDDDKKAECWFCLSSPMVEKHLILSMADHSYLALAKGGIVEFHVLITSISHFPALSVVPDDVLKEIEQYKDALKRFFSSKNQRVVFYERAHKTSHLQIHCIPLEDIRAQEAETTYKAQADDGGFDVEIFEGGSKSFRKMKDGQSYFYAEVPGNKEMLIKIDGDFPLSFGREAIAEILNSPDRKEWKNCVLDQEQASKVVKKFKNDFSSFDFAMDD